MLGDSKNIDFTTFDHYTFTKEIFEIALDNSNLCTGAGFYRRIVYIRNTRYIIVSRGLFTWKQNTIKVHNLL